jgi:hypothetical protein
MIRGKKAIDDAGGCVDKDMLFHHVVRRKGLQQQTRQDNILTEVNEMFFLLFGSLFIWGRAAKKMEGWRLMR